MTSMYNSLYSKNTTIWPSPLTTQSPCRGSYRRFYGSCSNPIKTRRIRHATNYTTPKPSNRFYSISIYFIILVGHNYNQLNLPSSNRPKIPHRIFFCKPHSTCHRSHPHPNTLKLYRGYRSNNCPRPYILHTFLPSKLQL